MNSLEKTLEKNKCVLLIPDAGPLISLWTADALDLLVKTRLPIAVADMVYYVVASRSDKYQQDRDLKKFIREEAYQIQTEIGDRYNEIKEVKPDFKPMKHEGELAILNIIENNLENYTKTNPILILFEDSIIPKLLGNHGDNVHIISTIGFLKRLEENNIIPSADEIINKIKESGRNINMLDFEKETDNGSSWLPEM